MKEKIKSNFGPFLEKIPAAPMLNTSMGKMVQKVKFRRGENSSRKYFVGYGWVGRSWVMKNQ